MIFKKKKIMQKKVYKKGSLIFSQNENSNEIYILNQGTLEIIIDNKVVAEISQRGVFFGEMAFLLNEKRNATIKTKTDCSCIVIYSQYVDPVIRSNPEIGINLMKALAKRLKKTTQSFLEANNKKNTFANETQINNIYDFLSFIKIVTKEQLNKSFVLYNEDNKSKNFTSYLSKTAQVNENDLINLIKLFKKYYK